LDAGIPLQELGVVGGHMKLNLIERLCSGRVQVEVIEGLCPGRLRVEVIEGLCLGRLQVEVIEGSCPGRVQVEVIEGLCPGRFQVDVLRGLTEKAMQAVQQVVMEVHVVGDNLEVAVGLLKGAGFMTCVVDQDEALRGSTIYNIYAKR
jgi:hypothetical protein